MGTLGKVILGLLVASGTAAAYVAIIKSRPHDVPFEQTLTDDIQISQAVHSSPSSAKIGEREDLEKYSVDDDDMHYLLCYKHAVDAVTLAALEKAMTEGGNNAGLEEIRDSIDEIVIGSLQDWLFQFARRISPPMAPEKNLEPAINELIHECRLQHFQHAGYPHIRRNSSEMRKLEQCYNNKTCLGGTF